MDTTTNLPGTRNGVAGWVRRLSVALALVMVASVGVAAPAHASHTMLQTHNGLETNQPAWTFIPSGGWAGRTTNSSYVRTGSWGGGIWDYTSGGFGGEARLAMTYPWRPSECRAQIRLRNLTPSMSFHVRYSARTPLGLTLDSRNIVPLPPVPGYSTWWGYTIIFTPTSSSFVITLELFTTHSGGGWNTAAFAFDDLVVQCVH